jgi:hypothetical protein
VLFPVCRAPHKKALSVPKPSNICFRKYMIF